MGGGAARVQTADRTAHISHIKGFAVLGQEGDNIWQDTPSNSTHCDAHHAGYPPPFPMPLLDCLCC
jgi:hypothetical protein